MPTIDLTDAELAAATAAIRGVVETDKYPHARGCSARSRPRFQAETTFQIEHCHRLLPKAAASQNRQAGAALPVAG
jgi:hypothetical protein